MQGLFNIFENYFEILCEEFQKFLFFQSESRRLRLNQIEQDQFD